MGRLQFSSQMPIHGKSARRPDVAKSKLCRRRKRNEECATRLFGSSGAPCRRSRFGGARSTEVSGSATGRRRVRPVEHGCGLEIVGAPEGALEDLRPGGGRAELGHPFFQERRAKRHVLRPTDRRDRRRTGSRPFLLSLPGGLSGQSCAQLEDSSASGGRAARAPGPTIPAHILRETLHHAPAGRPRLRRLTVRRRCRGRDCVP